MTPIEKLFNDIRRQTAAAETGAAERRDTESRRARAAREPMTSAQIEGTMKLIAETAHDCDMALADVQEEHNKVLVSHTNQIKALEEAICPRVAARLTALERAVTRIEKAQNTPAPAADDRAARAYLVNCEYYSLLEGRVAAMLRNYSCSDFQRAREIIELVRRS